MSNNPSLQKQAKALFIGNFLATILTLLTPMVLVRFISTTDMGIYRQFMLIAGPAVTILGMGYRTSLFYFYPISGEEGRNKIIQQTQYLFIVNCLLMIFILMVFGDEIINYFDFKNASIIKKYLILYISFELLASIIENIFTLEKNLKLNMLYFPLEKIVRFILFVTLLWLVPGYYAPVIAITIFAGLRFLFLAQHILPYYKKLYTVDFGLVKNQLLYSLPFGFAIVLDVVAGTFDKYVINKYITPAEFAIYAQAFVSIPFLTQFFKSIHEVVVPKIAVLIADNKMSEASLLWRKTVDKTTSLTIPAVFIFGLLANEIITILYTIEYIEAAKYYRIYILMFFVAMFSYNIILRGANKTKYIIIGSIIGVLLTITLGLILIPKLGTYGAAITSLMGAITPMLVSIHIERRIMGLSIKDWVNWKKIFTNFIICFFTALPIYLLKDNIQNLYLRFFLSGTAFTLIILYLQIKFELFIFGDALNNMLTKVKKSIFKRKS